MGGISTGVGIFSGVNSAQLIDQLLAIEARPKVQIQTRIVTLQQQKASLLDLNTSLLALQSAAGAFRVNKSFSQTSATTSNDSALTASAGTSATPGSYSFIVDRLVTSQQSLSKGFVDSDSTGVGLTRLTFENGGGSLRTETALVDLNGAQGVQRGTIKITDKAGGTAEIDLSRAVTIDDVLKAINSESAIQITATIEGDGLAIADTSGGAGTLQISDTFGSTTATDLGIETSGLGLGSGAGVDEGFSGARIRTISGQTPLASLNDGKGVFVRDGGGTDFIITSRSGLPSHNVALGDAKTIQDVIDAINTQTGGDVTASINADKTGLTLTDNTGGVGDLIVQNGVGGRTTATDLGIETSGVSSDTLDGKRVIAGLNSSLVRNLGGGSGLSAGSIFLTDRNGDAASITVTSAELSGSIEDLLATINTKISASNPSADITATINDAGNGIALVDASGGTGDLTASGTLATTLGLDQSVSADSIQGGSAQLQWFTRSTKLEDLNAGAGVGGTGTIRITTKNGQSTTLSIGNGINTVDDFIQFASGFNGLPFTIGINDQGDGLVVTDTSGGTGELKIEDVSGVVAKRLNLAGTAADAETTIDGSFEKTLEFDAGDTLDDIVAAINNASAPIAAQVIQDGSGAAPFRLNLSARNTGTAGRTIIDTGGFDLGLTELSRGDDAIVFFGSDDPARGVLLRSSTNTLDDVIRGVTIDLKGRSESAVEVNVVQDLDAIEKDIGTFVESYNRVVDKINQVDRFDAETETRGPLFGDPTVAALRTNLQSTAQGTPLGLGGQFDRLFQVGVSLGAGGKIEFDREKFREAYEADPEGVEQLFSAREVEETEEFEDLGNGVSVRNTSTDETFTVLGVAEQIAELMKGFTDDLDGRITRRQERIDDTIERQEDRIDQIDARLEIKRARLEQQFLAMEQAIAQLQTQSQALSQLG